ncbi:MAG: hypothetical protein LIO63_02270 [Akkermansia sp.]|nr:hypothetical protein [Akkermansia sp.]
MTDGRDFLILPAVKRGVSAVSRGLLALCGLMAFAAAAEFAAFAGLCAYGERPCGDFLFAAWLAAGLAAQYAWEGALWLAALLAPWCCRVLLGRGGNLPVRALADACLLMAGFIVFERLSRACFHVARFAEPQVFPLYLAALLGVLIFAAAPFYRAASGSLRACLYAAGVSLPLAGAFDTPSTWPLHAVFALAAALSLARPALLLARTARLIVSLPEP